MKRPAWEGEAILAGAADGSDRRKQETGLRIGILSDTHGRRHAIERAFDVLGDCDCYLHAGDFVTSGDGALRRAAEAGKLFMVRGNCDLAENGWALGLGRLENRLFRKIGPYAVFMTHGQSESFRERLKLARKSGANLLIYGHSHVKELFILDGVAIVNPGSAALPRDGSPSVALLEGGRLKLLETEKGETLAELNLSALLTTAENN